MIHVTKYSIGDEITFKNELPETASNKLKEKAGKKAVVENIMCFSGPCYELEGVDGIFTETCFEEPEVKEPQELTKDTQKSDELTDSFWMLVEDSPVFVCGECYGKAMNDESGRSAATKFCPHCGRYMTNHLM